MIYFSIRILGPMLMLIFLTIAITSDQNGSQSEPKATNVEAKGCQNEPRDLPEHPLRNMIEKNDEAGGGPIDCFGGSLFDQKSIKIP